MKTSGILHADLSRLVASLGHGDLVVIGDAGLPVPPGVPVIDLAVTHGVPTFAQVLAAVLSEMCVERCTMAAEAAADLRALAPLPPQLVPHATFKSDSAGARAILRTGEITPYANIALYAGVTF